MSALPHPAPGTRGGRPAGWLLTAGVALAWELAGRSGMLNERLLPRPAAVAGAWWRLLMEGELARDATASVARVLVGFGVAAVTGVAAGAAVTLVRPLAAQLRPLLELLRPIPPIAWIPLAVLWFGIGNRAAVFVVALGAFFPIFLNTADGIAGIHRAHVDTARSLGAGRRMLLTDVLLPAALPQILTGLRVGLGMGWMSVIAAELVGAQSGLGYMIQLNRVVLRTENVIAGMLTIGLVGLVMHRLTWRLERAVVPWTGATLGGADAGAG